MMRLQVFPADADILDRTEIATSCHVPWESLAGDDRVRHCGRCRQNVYNVEAMPRAEALRLLEEREGRLCLRLYRRNDGTVVTSDCWSRLRAARRKGRLAFLVMLIVVGWAQVTAMLAGIDSLRKLTSRPNMGAPIAPPPSISTTPDLSDRLPAAPGLGRTMGIRAPRPSRLRD